MGVAGILDTFQNTKPCFAPKKAGFLLAHETGLQLKKARTGSPFCLSFGSFAFGATRLFPECETSLKKFRFGGKNEKRGDSNFLQNFLLFRIFSCSFTKSKSFLACSLLGPNRQELRFKRTP